MKKNIVDYNKIAETLGVAWEHPAIDDCSGGVLETFKKRYDFVLREKGKKEAMTLSFDEDCPNDVNIDIEAINGYQSNIYLEGIIEVKYIPEYRTIELITEKLSLKIMWRGQFDLTVK